MNGLKGDQIKKFSLATLRGGMNPSKVSQLAPATFATMTDKQLDVVLKKPKMAGAVTVEQLRSLTDKQVKKLPKKFVNALSAEKQLALTQDPTVEPAGAAPTA